MRPYAGFSFEPLGDHDRASFHCGVPSLDEYLHQRAGQDARRKAAAPFVMLAPSGAIAGYYTLSAYAVRLIDLPPAIAKTLPRYPLVPATLLGRLAVSQDLQARGLGGFLLMDALRRSLAGSRVVASAGVVADALDDDAAAFYAYHGFKALPQRPKTLVLPMTKIEKVLG
ncbi:MAG: GNAT family N-acetyltransferase [Bryobacterales bacterium]|nr:GNAT family N-acetyltransferase [Bryobacterales bacterium]